MQLTSTLIVLAALARTGMMAAYSGILINGLWTGAGTQLYDPFNTPHATGNLKLGLPTDSIDSDAIIVGPLAYFGGANEAFVVYNTATNSTTTLPSMNQDLQHYAMAALTSGNIVLCGGQLDSNAFVSDCNMFDVTKATWTASTALPATVAYHAMVSLNGRPFVLGGYSGLGGTPYNNVYSLDGTTWTARKSMPIGLFDHAAVALDANSILVCGGFALPHTVLGACNTYDATADAWTAGKPLKKERFAHGLALYKGRVFAYGGRDVNAQTLASVEMMDSTQGWQILAWPMFAGDFWFESVALP